MQINCARGHILYRKYELSGSSLHVHVNRLTSHSEIELRNPAPSLRSRRWHRRCQL